LHSDWVGFGVYRCAMLVTLCMSVQRLRALQNIASAVSGLMASGLLQLRGVRGLEGWRWLFIVDGELRPLNSRYRSGIGVTIRTLILSTGIISKDSPRSFYFCLFLLFPSCGCVDFDLVRSQYQAYVPLVLPLPHTQGSIYRETPPPPEVDSAVPSHGSPSIKPTSQ
jgi:hypothetical protein